MKRTLGVAGTVLIHLLVVLALLKTTATAAAPPKKAVPVAINFDHEDRLTGEEREGYGLTCSGFHYAGIGLTFGGGTGRIIDVGAGTPAEKAGLRPGDVMIDTDQLAPDRFQIGTTLVLRILRDGLEIGVPITIGRICNE